MTLDGGRFGARDFPALGRQGLRVFSEQRFETFRNRVHAQPFGDPFGPPQVRDEVMGGPQALPVRLKTDVDMETMTVEVSE